MKLCITSWSLPYCRLEESSKIAQALGIEGLDVGYFYRSSLDKPNLLKEPKEYGKTIREKLTGLEIPCLYHLFGNSLEDRNLAHPKANEKNLPDFKQALLFCQSAGIPTIFVLPGVINSGQSQRDALESSAKNLKELSQVALDSGISLTIEPHIHSYLESVQLTKELLERAPNLYLTLDYSHFVCMGYRQEEIDELIPWARHVHLRQSTIGKLQCKLAHGILNFPAMFGKLKEQNYKGWMALEYVHQDYMNTLYEDVLSETIQLRDLFYTWSS